VVVDTIVRGTRDIGFYEWDISSPVGSGSNFQIKIVSYSDESQWDVSNTFSITSIYHGASITVTWPATGDTMQIASSATIRWNTDGYIGNYVKIDLYNDTGFVETIRNYISDNGYFIWSNVQSSLGSGSTYRIQVSAYNDQSIKGISNFFTIVSQYTGAYAITTPDTSSAWSAGSTYTIRWTSTGNPGTSIKLELWNDSGRVALIDSNLYNNDSIQAWNIPYSVPSDTNYRVKITSNNDPNNFDYSAYFSITQPPPAGHTNNGYVTISEPYYTTMIQRDTIISIRWTSSDSMTGTALAIYLYQNDTLAYTIIGSTIDDSLYNWYVPTTLASGSHYHIKIVNTSDTSQWDMGHYFQIASQYSGNIAVTAPVSDTTLLLNSYYYIRWVTAGTIGSYVKIDLYNDASFVQTIDASEYNDGSYYWRVASLQGSGDKYRIRISSNSDPGIYAFSGHFSIASQYSGSYAIAIPDSVWTTSTTRSIQWTSTGNPGTSVRIELFNNTTLAATIASSTSNDGSQTYYVSACMGSGSQYRVKVSSSYDAGVYAYSDYFTIQGIAPDQYEEDDLRSSASTIAVTGAIQSHTITLNDTDWVAFTADSGHSYLIRNSGSTPSRTYIYYGTETSYTTYLLRSSASSTDYRSWACTKSGQYYAKIWGYSTSYCGDYNFTVSDYDSLDIITFANPTSLSTWAAGSQYTIQWTTDSVLFGTYVELYLYKGGALLQSIDLSEVNDGSYSWYVPGGLTTGSDYQIRIVDDNNSTIFGTSDAFTIVGVEPDAFEPDNERDSASSITANGTVQPHTITVRDTDWVAFAADSGKSYFIGMATASTLSRITIYYNTLTVGSLLRNSSSDDEYLIWNCVNTGTHHVRITGYTTSSYGPYNLSVTEFDSLNLVTYTNPVSSSSWNAGTSNQVQYTTDSLLVSNYLVISLCEDTVVIQNLHSGSYASNTGSYTWSVPSGFESGSNYRIRIRDYYDSDIRGYSDPFTISGVDPDAYENDDSMSVAKTITVDGTVQIRSLSRADIDWVRFTAVAGRLYVIRDTSAINHRLYLHRTSPTSYLEYDTGTDPEIVWTCTSSGTYYVRVSYYSTSYYGDYGLSVTEYDPASMLDFTNPNSASTWSTSSNYSIQWNPDTTLLGTYVRIYLLRDSVNVMNLDLNDPNDGIFPWTIPPSLPTSNAYQIKIANYSNASIFGLSDSFTISGIEPDVYEVDDSISVAKAITTDGTQQNRNLTYGDIDYHRFSAARNHVYVINATGTTARPRLYLYDTDGTTLLGSDNTSSTDTVAEFVWFCSVAGDYYFRISSLTSYTGDYSSMVNGYDSTQYRFNVVSPPAGTTFVAANVCNIQWQSTVSVGGNVDIYLYNSGGVVSPAILADTPNDGVHAWTVRSGLTPGSDYYIKIISRISPNIFGNSATFTIN
jgi:hypothetical protein